ncbi:hypothetical protein HNY73_003464 [Argiope bruennichi]|uniref:Uncharacterized protein n=1 Tax=Argiope bruennichi TaxID=94029 RepID=A0A8T0FL83_ARGBR|nr:hypothetical protein HNY73_003464 [Argiope bruennichi]
MPPETAFRSLPQAPTILKNEANLCYETAHVDNKATKRNCNQYFENLDGNSRNVDYSFSHPEEALGNKVTEGSTVHDNPIASKRKQKILDVVDHRKPKCEHVLPKYENMALEEETNKVTHEQTATVFGAQNKNISHDKGNMIITDSIDAYNQQCEENVLTSSKTAVYENMQAHENCNETAEVCSNFIKSSAEIALKECRRRRTEQNKPGTKLTAKSKIKAPKKSQTLPVTKRPKGNLKTKHNGQRNKK